MSRSAFKVIPWDVHSLKAETYDALIVAVGFETRARFIAEDRCPEARRRHAIAFTDRKVLAYADNAEWFARNGFDVEECSDAEFGGWCLDVLQRLKPKEENALTVCIDISSMSRLRIAQLVDAVLTHSGANSTVVDFVYALAKYSPAPRTPGPNRRIGAVLPQFAGWSDCPERPPVAILGLGYEQDKAVGALEYIQPAEVWAFEPVSPDPLYTKAIRRANETLSDVVPNGRRIEYRVARPFDCLVSLESLSYGAMRTGRPVLFPFGPKVFALCCLLVACIHPSMGVWRVSAESAEPPSDRIANGKVVGIRLAIDRRPIDR